MRSARAAVLLVLVLASSPQASAQDETSREALVAQAERARDEGDHEAALQLALRAAAIRASPSLELFIAQQRALTGRRAEALEDAARCVQSAEADPALNNRDAILRTCRDLVDELRRGVALVTVRVPSAQPDLRVVVNGRVLTREQWGRPQPVEPGTVHVEAQAPGATIRQSVIVGTGEHSTVEIRFDAEPVVEPEVRGLSPLWLALPLSIAGGLAVAATLTGAVVLDRGAAYASLYDECASGQASACTDALGVRGTASDLQVATNVLWISAAVGAAAAIVTAFFVDWRDAPWSARGEAWPVVRF